MTTSAKRQPRQPTFYSVPAGTRPSECSAKDCKATIFWIVTASGAKMPVDCDVPGGQEPTAREDGEGVAHWGTCASPERFRR